MNGIIVKHSLLTKLSFVAFIFAVVVVVLGAFTRLVDAGLGCPDWPTCYGHLWVPNDTGEIEVANKVFESTPVETDKTWPEQIHRIFASTLGILVFAIFIIAIRKSNVKTPRSIIYLFTALLIGTVSRIFIGDGLDLVLIGLVLLYFANLIKCSLARELQSDSPLMLPALVAGLVILQGLFGMWTVTLKLWPQVVTAHLLGGFTTLSVLWLLVNRFAGWSWSLPAEQVVGLLSLRKLTLAALSIVVVQVALGGWVSSNYAALACPDLPLCHGQLIPDVGFVKGFDIFQSIGPNYLGGLLDSSARVAIHFSHRVGAIAVAIIVGLLIVKLVRNSAFVARRFGVVLTAVLVAQIALGISNVAFSLPLWIAVLHNAGGALLILTLVALNHRLHTIKTT